jgi:hypothetical protein
MLHQRAQELNTMLHKTAHFVFCSNDNINCKEPAPSSAQKKEHANQKEKGKDKT